MRRLPPSPLTISVDFRPSIVPTLLDACDADSGGVQEAMLADLQLVRKHLETANDRNQTLFHQLTDARDTLVTCDDERLDWRKQYVARRSWPGVGGVRVCAGGGAAVWHSALGHAGYAGYASPALPLLPCACACPLPPQVP